MNAFTYPMRWQSGFCELQLPLNTNAEYSYHFALLRLQKIFFKMILVIKIRTVVRKLLRQLDH